jgi:hypothetical protein
VHSNRFKQPFHLGYFEMTHIALFGDLVHGPTQAHRRRTGFDIGNEPTRDGGLAITLAVDGSADPEHLNVTVQGPARFAGVFTVARATLAAGTPVCLVPPAIHEPQTGATTLHAQPGLWVYDRTAFAAAGAGFAVSRVWTHDGVAVVGETDTSYARRAGDEAVVIGLVEQAAAGGGAGIAAAAVPLPAAQPEPEVPTVRLSDADSAVVVEGLDATATHVALTIAAPSPYAGSYTVPLADLAAGQPVCLAVPTAMAGAGNLLTARPGLWVYDPAAYAAASATFGVEYAWTDDNGAVLDADELTWTRSTYRAVRFREVAAAVGQAVAATSDPVPAITIPTTVIAAGAPRPVGLGSIFAGRRAIAFATSATVAGLAATQRLLSRDNGGSTNTPGVQITTSGNVQIITGGPTVGAFTLPNLTTSAAGIVSLANPKIVIAASADLDRYGAAANRQTIFAKGAGTAVNSVGADATAHDASLAFHPAGALFARPNVGSWSEPFSGTVHGWVWIHDAPIPAETLRDALFEPVAASVDVVEWLPRLLPDDGTVMIGGVSVTPRVFLRGERYDQYEASPGVWVVPNRGSAGGNLSLLNGAFA